MQTADFTIADVLAWARTKPADERYDYWCDRCAIGQFLVETRRATQPCMAGTRYYDGSGTHHFPVELDKAAYCARYGHHTTFGTFVRRLEKLLPAEPLSDTWTTPDAYLTDIEDVARERCSA